MLRPALHLGGHAYRRQLALHLPAALVDATLALHPFLGQQAGQLLVVSRLHKTERQVFHLPLDLPDAQPVGQRRKHLKGFLRQRRRARLAGSGKPAQCLQPGRQPQQHHAQIARERQQHLAHPLGLASALLGPDLRLTRRALDLHQLAGVRHQAGVAGTKGLGHHLFGALQIVTRVDQVDGSAQRGTGADAGQDAGHTVGMAQRVFAGVQPLAGEQGFGKTAGAVQCVGARRVGAAVRAGRAGARRAVRSDDSARAVGQQHDGSGTATRQQRIGFHAPGRAGTVSAVTAGYCR